ncbi:MAG: polysaccharide deacetylase family protein, partial [Marmoricola sp.]
MAARGARARQREPRTHWILFAVLLGLVFVLLLIAGFTSGQLGESAHAPRSRASSARVPDRIIDGGPVVDPGATTSGGLRLRPGHVALTFDDGPSKWTAQILDVLARHHVKATFFVVGSHIADRPDLVRRMYAEGHEVGIHTFTHVNLANVPGWRRRLELDQTQLALAASTGHTTDLLRL